MARYDKQKARDYALLMNDVIPMFDATWLPEDEKRSREQVYDSLLEVINDPSLSAQMIRKIGDLVFDAYRLGQKTTESR